MKILTWEIKNFDWNIDNIWNLTLWYLKQIYSDNENKLVREELRDAFTKIVETEEPHSNAYFLSMWCVLVRFSQ